MNQEIQNLMQTYQRSLNEAGVDLVRWVYAPDAMFIRPPFPTATGIEENVALYADFLSKLDFDVQFDVQEIELNGYETQGPESLHLQRRGLKVH